MADIEKSPIFGGGGGSMFDDYTSAPAKIKRIVLLKIRSGTLVDAIQATYELEDGKFWEAPQHGGNGGKPSQVSLNDQELIAMLPRSGTVVDQLRFAAMEGPVVHGYGPFGGDGGGANATVGNIVALYGRSGQKLDAIGVYGYHLISTVVTASKEELATEAEAIKRVPSSGLAAGAAR